MIHFFFMTLIAGIIFIAAFELDRNYINGGVIMNATGIIVNWFAFNLYFVRIFIHEIDCVAAILN